MWSFAETTGVLARSLSLFVLLAAFWPATITWAQSSRRCVDAASALVQSSSGIRVDAAPARRTPRERTERWASRFGHEGLCRFDASGRLYAVEITRFPDDADSTGEAYTVTCESNDNRRRNCPLRSSDSIARLERQLSRSSCVEGRTFGISGSTLWVDDGCRGVFLIEPSWRPYVIECSSSRYSRQECRIRRNAAVRLLRTTSRSPCTDGRTWGYFGATLWVDDGCSGEFEVYPATQDRADFERARSACRRQIEREGLSVWEEESIRQLGPLVEVTLRTGRGPISTAALCTFDPRTGRAETRSR